MKNKIYPPATIGIFGGGQLGKMLAQDAKKMGYKVVVLDPMENSPCAQVCDEEIVARFDDKSSAIELARRCDIVTYEFENIPSETIRYVERCGYKVLPSSDVLEITQSRLKEKRFLTSLGIPTADFKDITNRESLYKQKLPVVLKTVSGGYDGKGQFILKTSEDIRNLSDEFFNRELIAENFVNFVKEISVICARDADGNKVVFPISENIHKNNILHITIVPARVSKAVEIRAVEIAKKIADAFSYVGVMCVEMFLLEDDAILVNEIAPRVHNSGHYTIEAVKTSQFEQHIRAICGLPLGSTDLLKFAVMLNIIGPDGVYPDAHLYGIDEILKLDGVKIHLYGKSSVKAGRKMGHITIISDSVEEALNKADTIKNKIFWTHGTKHYHEDTKWSTKT